MDWGEHPAEHRLKALVRHFAQGEDRIRALIAQAPTGDRQALYLAVLSVLSGLREQARGAGPEIERAYMVVVDAIHRLTDLPTKDQARVSNLADSLVLKLDAAVTEVEARSRVAVTKALSENADEVGDRAVRVPVKIGVREVEVTLGDRAEVLGRTMVRRATSRATADMLGELGRVVIVGGDCSICKPIQGERSALTEPPFHPHCDCVAIPLGFTQGAFMGAME